MVQSIELLLDEAGDQRVRAAWAALDEADLPSLAGHTGGTNAPHVTVAVAAEGLDVAAEAVRAVLRGWQLDEQGLAVEVGAPLLFGGHRGRWVLARQIVPSRPLLTLHAAVHRAIASASPDAEVVELTRPDRWTPHVTLAQRMPADRMGEALAVLDPTPVACRFVGARLWDSGPKTVTPLG